MDAQLLELARKMIDEVYGHGRTELIAQICAPTMIAHDPIAGDLDVAAIQEQVRMYRRAFPDLRMGSIDVLTAGEDTVAVRWRASGTQRGEIFGVPPTGRSATVDGISLIRTGGSLLQESWAQWDALGLMRQLGVLPAIAPRTNGDGTKRAAAEQPRR